jgi:membrane protein
VNRFADYNATYGSIGGVILLMLWLYWSGVALLVGAEIDSTIERAAIERALAAESRLASLAGVSRDS